MAAKIKTTPTLTAELIMDYYMKYCLENNKKPASVFLFSKENGFSEKEFYQFYASLEVIEKTVFTKFHEMALNLVAGSADYAGLGFREKLLTYYFTLFEILTANRSYVVYALKGEKSRLDSLSKLTDFRTTFKSFISIISSGYLTTKSEKIKKLQQDALDEGAWVQLMITMKFWLDDESAGFEKTDLFIEKSIRATFDVLAISPLESVIDFGKFLFKEKVK
jgi:hypothetical protein